MAKIGIKNKNDLAKLGIDSSNLKKIGIDSKLLKGVSNPRKIPGVATGGENLSNPIILIKENKNTEEEQEEN